MERPACGGLWVNFALHLACWIASAVEAWLVLRLAGEPLSFGAVLVLVLRSR